MGEDPCVAKLPCEYCDLLTPEQVIQVATPTYKLRKEKAKSKQTLMDPASVTVVGQVDPQDVEPSVSTHEPSSDLSLPQPSFRKDLQELDEKWSVCMARLEALLTLGHRPASQPSFSPVKAPVTHQAPAGSISQAPFLLTSVPSGQAAPASRTLTRNRFLLDLLLPARCLMNKVLNLCQCLPGMFLHLLILKRANCQSWRISQIKTMLKVTAL